MLLAAALQIVSLFPRGSSIAIVFMIRGALVSTSETRVGPWLEHLYDTKPIRPRFWRYVLVYPPGPPDVPFEHWTVRYVPAREEFVAHCVATMKR